MVAVIDKVAQSALGPDEPLLLLTVKALQDPECATQNSILLNDFRAVVAAVPPEEVELVRAEARSALSADWAKPHKVCLFDVLFTRSFCRTKQESPRTRSAIVLPCGLLMAVAITVL